MDIDRFEQKKQKKKHRVRSSGFESDNSTLSYSEDELIRIKRMKKRQTQTDSIRESILKLKKLWTC